MSDEKPLPLKRKFSTAGRQLICVVHYDTCKETEILPLSDDQIQQIRNVAKLRQAQSTADLRLDSLCSSLPVMFIDEVHGHHRYCYKKFTQCNLALDTTLDREHVSGLSTGPTENVASKRRSERNTSAMSTPLLPQDCCIFCSKQYRYKGRQREVLITCVTNNSEASIKAAAVAKCDYRLLGIVQNVDLIAKEARYHDSCRRDYVRKSSRPHHSQRNDDDTSSLRDSRLACDEAFKFLCEHVQVSVCTEGKVERMTMLLERYQTFMKNTYPEFHSPSYTTQNLKSRLVGFFGDKLSFVVPQARNKSELVFASDIDMGEAIETAFEAATSEKRILEKAALILNRKISEALHTSQESVWPPKASDLADDVQNGPPNVLTEFISQTIMGRKSATYSSRVTRLSSSIASDICVAVSNGQWMMPKHILLGMTLRHLTGSAEIVTILNRFGHCQSYLKILELETAIANAVQATDDVLPSNIVTKGNIVSLMCWDNFDVNEETRSGMGTTHITHGIIIQTADPLLKERRECVSQPRTKQRTFKPVPFQVPSCFVPRNAEPNITVANFKSQEQSVRQWLKEDIAWLLCRGLLNSKFSVPSWNGWVSEICDSKCVAISDVGYMKPIFSPATDYATVQQCLVTSVAAMEKMNQEFVFVTFDLAMAKIAFNIVWHSAETFSKVLINLGSFHTMCTYMAAIGKMMTGSGFEEIVIESGVCASGSISQVMSGKHYNRALRVHHNMLDAVSRLLLEAFDKEYPFLLDDLNDLPVSHLSNEPCAENLSAVLDCEKCQTIITHFQTYIDSVRQGKMGKTAEFWIKYCDCVWTLLRFLRAVKENDFDNYVTGLRQLCPLIFSADRLNYARYLPFHYVQLKNLSTTHPGAENLLEQYGISVARSRVPSCRIPVDMTIEQTINRSAKTSGGLIGFTRNAAAYQRWVLARHERAAYLEATYDIIGICTDHPEIHKATTKADMKHSESEVCALKNAIQNFINPFHRSTAVNDSLFCISSGLPVPTEIEHDLLNYEHLGEAAVVSFIEDRLVSKQKKFQEPMHKLKLKTFQSMAVKKSMTTSQRKTVRIAAERNVLGHVLLAAQGMEISFEKLFSYPLSPVPWSIGTPDGCFVKTNKADLLHILEGEGQLYEGTLKDLPFTSTVIVDGNAMLQSMVQVPNTFGEFALLVFRCLPKVQSVHFVTDSYYQGSIKDTERVRRGISKTHLIGGPLTKMPSNFAEFMRNNDNKRSLIQFMLSQWQTPSYVREFGQRVIYFVCERKCHKLQLKDGVIVVAEESELGSEQEEADTRIILHCFFVSQLSNQDSVTAIRSPDTDVFVLLVHFAEKISGTLLFDTGVGNKRRLINVKSVSDAIGDSLAKALPAFHAFTGSDCTSAFVRRGKKNPYKLLKNNVNFQETFAILGSTCNSQELSSKLHSSIANFVCAMYGKPNSCDTHKVRSEIFQTRYGNGFNSLVKSSNSGIDLSLLPPCSSSLRLHTFRANYQAFIWKKADCQYPDVLGPNGNGWFVDEERKLQIHWTDGDIVPTDIAEILAENYASVDISEEDVEEDDEVDNILDFIFASDDEIDA